VALAAVKEVYDRILGRSALPDQGPQVPVTIVIQSAFSRPDIVVDATQGELVEGEAKEEEA